MYSNKIIDKYIETVKAGDYKEDLKNYKKKLQKKKM